MKKGKIINLIVEPIKNQKIMNDKEKKLNKHFHILKDLINI
jgi:hypothetical protein